MKRHATITPELVAERTAAIRASWTSEERERRRVFKGRPTQFSVRTVSTSDLCEDAHDVYEEMFGWEYLEDAEVREHNKRYEERHKRVEEQVDEPEESYVEAVVVEFGN